MTPLAMIFATAVTWCAGPAISAEKCTTKWMEAEHLMTVKECNEKAFTFIDELSGTAMVRGIKCLKLGDLIDAND